MVLILMIVPISTELLYVRLLPLMHGARGVVYHLADMSAAVNMLQGEANGDLPTVRSETGLRLF
jgi:hypothetical protein